MIIDFVSDFGFRMELIFQCLVSVEFTRFWCLLIIASGICGFWDFYHSYKKISNGIASATRILSALPSYTVEDSESFREKYDEALEELESNSIISVFWKAFDKNVFSSDAYGLDSDIHREFLFSKRESRDFLNEETLWLSQFNEKFHSAMPSWLTGLGILGTFIGLAAGISLASPGISSLTSETSSITTKVFTETFNPLLGGAGQAFCTSIVGLICSLSYSFAYKIISNKSLSIIENLNEAIENKVKFISTEEIELLNYRVHKRQLTLTQELSDGWHTEFQKMMEAVTGSLAELQGIFKTFSSEQITKIQDQMDSNAKAFAQLAACLKEIHAALEMSSDKQTSQFQDLMDSNSKAFKALRESIEKLEKTSADQLGKLQEANASSFAALKDAFSGFSAEQLNNLKDVVDGLLDSVSKKLAEELDQMALAFKDTAASIGMSAETLDGTLDKMTTAVNSTSEKVDASLVAMDQHVSNINKELQSATMALKAACNEAVSATMKVGEEVINFTSEASRRFSSVADNVSASMSKSGSDFAQAVHQSGEGWSKVLAKSAEETQKAYQHTVEQIQDAGSEFADCVEHAGKSFSGSIESGVKTLETSLVQQSEILGRVAKFHEGLAGLEKSITTLTQDLAASGKAVKNAVSTIEVLKTSMTDIMRLVSADISKANKLNEEAMRRGLTDVSNKISDITRVQEGILKESSIFTDFVEKAYQQIADQSEKTNSSFVRNVTELDDRIASAVRSLRDGLDSWEKAQDRDREMATTSLKEDVSILRSAIDDLGKNLNAGMLNKNNSIGQKNNSSKR